MDGLSVGQSIAILCYGAIATLFLYMTWREARRQSPSNSPFARLWRLGAMMLCLMWPLAIAGMIVAIVYDSQIKQRRTQLRSQHRTGSSRLRSYDTVEPVLVVGKP